MLLVLRGSVVSIFFGSEMAIKIPRFIMIRINAMKGIHDRKYT